MAAFALSSTLGTVMTADSPLSALVGPTWFDLRGLAELAMHNTRQLYQLQFDVWRALLETQARAAAPFGFPAAAYGAVLCGGGPQRPWSLAVRSGVPPWLTPTGSGEAGLEMQRQFGALFGGPTSLAVQGWQQALSRCVAQADAALRQWWEMAEQQVEELGDAAEAGRDALLDAADPASDPPRAEEVPDAAGEKSQRRLAGERSRHGRAA